jgi:hypothetical protein
MGSLAVWAGRNDRLIRTTDTLRKAFAAVDGTQERSMLKQSFVAAALVALATGASAEGIMTVPPDFEDGAGAYLSAPPVVPPDGCVWNNSVFSNGAILERRQMPWAFFRCVQGSWRSFDSFDEAAAGREFSRPGATTPRRLQP